MYTSTQQNLLSLTRVHTQLCRPRLASHCHSSQIDMCKQLNPSNQQRSCSVRLAERKENISKSYFRQAINGSHPICRTEHLYVCLSACLCTGVCAQSIVFILFISVQAWFSLQGKHIMPVGIHPVHVCVRNGWLDHNTGWRVGGSVIADGDYGA